MLTCLQQAVSVIHFDFFTGHWGASLPDWKWVSRSGGFLKLYCSLYRWREKFQPGGRSHHTLHACTTPFYEAKFGACKTSCLKIPLQRLLLIVHIFSVLCNSGPHLKLFLRYFSLCQKYKRIHLIYNPSTCFPRWNYCQRMIVIRLSLETTPLIFVVFHAHTWVIK